MLRVISKSKNSKGQPTAQIVLNNKGKSVTKHVTKSGPKPGIFVDKHGIPFIIN